MDLNKSEMSFQDGIYHPVLISYLAGVSHKCVRNRDLSMSLFQTETYKRMFKLGAFLLVYHTILELLLCCEGKKYFRKLLHLHCLWIMWTIYRNLMKREKIPVSLGVGSKEYSSKLVWCSVSKAAVYFGGFFLYL